jgi:hypothetical protein
MNTPEIDTHEQRIVMLLTLRYPDAAVQDDVVEELGTFTVPVTAKVQGGQLVVDMDLAAAARGMASTLREYADLLDPDVDPEVFQATVDELTASAISTALGGA